MRERMRKERIYFGIYIEITEVTQAIPFIDFFVVTPNEVSVDG